MQDSFNNECTYCLLLIENEQNKQFDGRSHTISACYCSEKHSKQQKQQKQANRDRISHSVFGYQPKAVAKT